MCSRRNGGGAIQKNEINASPSAHFLTWIPKWICLICNSYNSTWIKYLKCKQHAFDASTKMFDCDNRHIRSRRVSSDDNNSSLLPELNYWKHINAEDTIFGYQNNTLHTQTALVPWININKHHPYSKSFAFKASILSQI